MAKSLKVTEASIQSGDDLVGQVIDGRYEIQKVLGEGGMGLVYLAKHTVLGKNLAIKVLRPDVSKDEEIITRFRQEAQSASSIGNQHIIDISDFGELPDASTYFVMEFLDGVDLTHAMEAQNPMEQGRVVHISKQLCIALGAAHDNGIVHRDLKPDNIFLIRREDDENFVKILDFGIAKVGGTSSKLTQAGQVFGTPHYMSPEQCSGGEIDQRTDIYALGIIMYEMVTGKVPFDADNLMGILTKHLYEDAAIPSELRSDLSKELEAIILRCIAKDSEERYQTMTEVLDDLTCLEVGESVGKETLSVRNTVIRGRKKKSKLGLLLTLFMLIAASAAFVFVYTQKLLWFEDPVVVTPPPEPKLEEIADAATAEKQEDASEEVAEKKITVRSEPEGVEVWQGDDFLGNTPLEIERPQDEERISLELRQPGYETRSFNITSSLVAPEVTFRLREESRRRTRPVPSRRSRGRSETKSEPASPPAKQTRPPRSHSEVINPWD